MSVLAKCSLRLHGALQPLQIMYLSVLLKRPFQDSELVLLFRLSPDFKVRHE